MSRNRLCEQNGAGVTVRAVLVTQRLVRTAKYPEERDALDVRWPLFLHAAGLIPIPVPSNVELEPFLTAIGDVAGLVLTGGNDIAAVCDDDLSRRRDALESALCSRMESLGKPILGVCRGLQFLAQRAGAPLTRVDGHAGVRHRVRVAPNSAWLAGHDGREVNSYHGFGFHSAPWRVAAQSPDGMIEALEQPERPTLGIMWHPERESPFHSADVRLFREFFG
jgi:gamma-glutamyl-gamma-aminobutyrate hydrolase PuuD